MKKSIAFFGARNALGTALYIVCVATFLFNAGRLFGPSDAKTVFIPIAMLLLFVVSAAVTGSLVLGQPILWYLDGKKKEAVALLMTTIGCLFFLMLVAFVMVARIVK